MSATLIYEVWGTTIRDGKVKHTPTASFYDRAEAAQALTEWDAGFSYRDESGANKYWRDLFVKTIEVTDPFRIPPLPMPRDVYRAETEQTSPPGTWDKGLVRIFKGEDKVFEFKRNYSGNPFEPFRQHGRDYALISPHYTTTAVVDLDAGKIIAQEEPASSGFCPVGFYVPDWYDVHEEAWCLPGSSMWEKAYEQPSGQYGFVWGCVWGDDSGGWKLERLDLSRIAEGVIARDQAFGYLELATISDDPKQFIHIDDETGSVRLAVYRYFDSTGKLVYG